MVGDKIIHRDGKLIVPDFPIVPFIEGDGIGPEIMKSAMKVWNEAVRVVYDGKKRIVWKEIYAGEKALKKFGEPLPKETISTIEEHLVAVKGPLTTPVGVGYRSLNVELRRRLDLYACVRPVKWIEGVETPVRHPEAVDVVIFRENTEDLYMGVEWEAESDEAEKLRNFLMDEFSVHLPEDGGIGLKIISKHGTERITKKAMEYVISKGRKSLTIVHKGNIMKYTEGSFLKWAEETIRKNYGNLVIFEDELDVDDGSKITVKNVIADNMFQQILLNPSDYDVILLPNLNGDYLSDAVSAQVGGIGLIPGANIGDLIALFEPTHGTAPKIAGKGMANPTSLILSGAMMFEHIGWEEVANCIKFGVEMTIKDGNGTIDLVKDKERALGTEEFVDEVIKRIHR